MPEVSRQIGYVFGQNTAPRTAADYQALRVTAKNLKNSAWTLLAVATVSAVLAGVFASTSYMVPLAAFTGIELGLAAGLTTRRHFLLNEIRSAVIEHVDPTVTPAPRLSHAAMMPTQDSEETHHLRMSMIEAAKHNVILSGNFCGGHIYDELLLALEKKMAANPNFKVIILAHPKFVKDQSNPMDYQNRTITDRLQKRFPTQFSYLPTEQYMHVNPGMKIAINHVKALVIDYGKYFMMGGTGVKHDFSLRGLDHEDGENVKNLPRHTRQRILQVITGLELKLDALNKEVLKSKNPEQICRVLGPLMSLKLSLNNFLEDNANIWPLIRHLRSLVLSLEDFPQHGDQVQNLQRTKFYLIKMLKKVQKETESGFMSLPSLLPRSFRDMDWAARSDGAGEDLYKQMLSLCKRYECLLEKKEKPFDLNLLHTYPAFTGDESMPIDQKDSVTTQLLKSHTPSLEDIDTTVYQIDLDRRLCANVPVKFICQGPENSESPLTQELIERFNQAESEIVINHMYFHPTPRVLKALIQAAKRGVSIIVISNDTHERSPTANSVFGPMNKSKYSQLLTPLSKEQRKHVHFYRYNEDNKANHKKAVVVDRRYVIMGSSNFGYKSLETTCDHEINASCESRGLARETLKVFEEDMQLSVKLDNQQHLSLYEKWCAFRYGIIQPLAG